MIGADGKAAEMGSGGNLGVKRLDIISNIKAAMERMCPMTVSCADIIAMAGRDAVAFNGGPDIRIPLGRRDASTSSATDADIKLPPATSSVDRVLSVFRPFGMSLAETVAILGPPYLQLWLPFPIECGSDCMDPVLVWH